MLSETCNSLSFHRGSRFPVDTQPYLYAPFFHLLHSYNVPSCGVKVNAQQKTIVSLSFSSLLRWFSLLIYVSFSLDYIIHYKSMWCHSHCINNDLVSTISIIFTNSQQASYYSCWPTNLTQSKGVFSGWYCGLGRGSAAHNTTRQTTSRPELMASTTNKLNMLGDTKFRKQTSMNITCSLVHECTATGRKQKTNVTLLQTKRWKTHRFYCWMTIMKYLYIIYILFSSEKN